MGLSTAAQLLGIDVQGMEHHRALDDSLLALACFRGFMMRRAEAFL